MARRLHRNHVLRDRTTTDLDERGLGSQRPVQNPRGLTLIVIVEAAVEVEAVTGDRCWVRAAVETLPL
jgi:hypothetical protein